MSPRTIEPPTVVTRPPLAVTPDLPASPPPSRHGHTPSSDCETRDASQESRKEERNGTGRPASCDAGERSASEDRDSEGRLKRRKQGREGRRARWRQLAEDWKLWMTLENSGSVARDHLASERTFLAYARTSLTIASTGVALVQLFTLSAEIDTKAQRFARPLGAVMIALGMFTLGVGALRYFLVQDALIRGVYPVARISASVLSFVLLAIILVVFVIILAAR
ncbi:hypothetical protein C2E23DRAFT_331752 [Lenzites betulinus]|nr:hypothetical protein C2E23DRAFT_331752 [Lenzites betulinus]